MAIEAPETAARKQLITLLGEVYSEEKFPIRNDKLHASVGNNGTVIAVYPIKSQASSRENHVLEMEVCIQFYKRYDLKVDPNQTVAPDQIEEYAERLRKGMFAKLKGKGTGAVWYPQYLRTVYPDDPTGNKTRYETFVLYRGNNNSIIG